MGSATLMVFLLDNIAGFSELLNVTFDNLHKENPDESYIQSDFCDPTVAEPILHIVDKQLHDHENKKKHGFYAPLDITESTDDSKFNSLSFEVSNEKGYVEPKDITEDDIITRNLDRLLRLNPAKLAADSVPKSNISTTTVGQISPRRVFSKSAPFLVAIFESLLNVTAQTCAGALLSPVWVLTTSNCIEVLEDVDLTSNKTSKNSYMVVAGARNPFKDGSIHNVTEIYVYPDNTSCYLSNETKAAKEKTKESVVLMKLATPAFNATAIKIAALEVVDHAKVKVWGWSSLNVSQSSSPATESHATSTLGIVRTCDLTEKAQETPAASTLCLSVSLNNTLSNGGPILVVENDEQKLLSLVYERDDTQVQPLDRHAAWIHQLTDIDIANTVLDISPSETTKPVVV